MPRSAYDTSLLKARQAYFQQQAPALYQAIADEYAGSMVRIVRAVRSQALTAERAAQLLSGIRNELQSLGRTVSADLEGRIQDLVKQVDAAHREAVQVEARRRGVSVKIAAELISPNYVVPSDVVEQMMIRRGIGRSTTFQTLFRRRVTDAAADLDQYLDYAIQTGMDNQALANEVAAVLARNDPYLKRAFDKVRASEGRILRSAIRKEVPKIPARKLKSLYYDGRRIAVSETNTAYFEADRVAAIRSPVVDLVIWLLSGRHAGLWSSPDICDIYAGQDLHGYGPGIYHPENVPALPHPHCGCSLGRQIRPVSEWLKPKDRPVPAPRPISTTETRIALQQAANRMSVAGRTLTATFVGNTRRAVVSGLGKAYQARRKGLTTAAPTQAPIPSLSAVAGQYKPLGDVSAAATWVETAYPHIRADFSGLDPTTVDESIMQFDKLAQRFPWAADTMQYLGRYQAYDTQIKRLETATAFARPSGDGRGIGIYLNPRAYSTEGRAGRLEGFKYSSRKDVRWSPIGGDSFEYIMTHEFGHIIDFYIRKSKVQFMPYAAASGIGLLSDTQRLIKSTHPATAALCRYALTNHFEQWAEAFASTYYTPRKNWTTLTRVVYQWLQILDRSTFRTFDKASEITWLQDLDRSSDEFRRASKELQDLIDSLKL